MMRYSFLDIWEKQPNLANLGNDSCKANHPRGSIYYLSFIIYHFGHFKQLPQRYGDSACQRTSL